MAAVNHPSNDITFIMLAISKADHSMLMHNQMYSELYERAIGMKAKLEALQ